MDHVAIMKKSWHLTEKILSGRKKAESRWYLTKRPPWNCIKKGEFIYFKNSGEPVKIRASVEKFIQIEGLTPDRISNLLSRYWKDLGLEKDRLEEFYHLVRNKKYCLLVFLSNPEKVDPFEIDKKGFGNMSAWISVEDVNKIRK